MEEVEPWDKIEALDEVEPPEMVEAKDAVADSLEAFFVDNPQTKLRQLARNILIC